MKNNSDYSPRFVTETERNKEAPSNLLKMASSLAGYEANSLRLIKSNPQLIKQMEAIVDTKDNLSDELAEAIMNKTISRADFEKAISEGIDSLVDANPILRNFCESAERIKEEIDIESAARGVRHVAYQNFFIKFAPGVIYGFFVANLSNNSAMSLSYSGATIEKNQMRMVETGFYVMSHIEGLKVGDKAYITSNRVRLVHSFVRLGIEKSGLEWDYKINGEPINTLTSLIASAADNISIVAYLQTHGFKFFEEEKKDIYELYRYKAILMGVSDAALSLVKNYDDVLAVLNIGYQFSPGPKNEKEHAIMKEIMQAQLENPPKISSDFLGKLSMKMVESQCREIFGEDIYESYGFSKWSFAHWVLDKVYKFNLAINRFMWNSTLLKPWYIKISKNMSEKMNKIMITKYVGKNHDFTNIRVVSEEGKGRESVEKTATN